MELGEDTGVDVGAYEQFFSQNCQGVTLLDGSPLGIACAAAGLLSAATYCPDAPPELRTGAQQAEVLIERYCNP
jgi:hypothetical protein